MRDLQSIQVKDFETTSKKSLIGGVGSGFLDYFDTFRKKSNQNLVVLIKPLLPASTPASSPAVMAVEKTKEKIRSQGLVQHVVELVEEHKTGLIVTGHSLGAAVSSLFIADFSRDNNDLLIKYRGNLHVKDAASPKRLGFYCINFGSPRVFDVKATKAVESYRTSTNPHLYEHLRYVNDGDFVTSLPRNWWQILYHVGSPIYAKELSAKWQYVTNQPNFGIDSLSGYFYQSTDFLLSKAADHSLSTKLGYMKQFKQSNGFHPAIESCQQPQVKKLYQALPLKIEE